MISCRPAVPIRVPLAKQSRCAILGSMMEQKFANNARIAGYIVGAAIVIAIAVLRVLAR